MASPAFDPPAEVAKERTLITDAPVAVAYLVRPPAIYDGAPLFHNRLDRGPCEDRERRRVVFLHVAEIVADALPRPGVRAGDDQSRERGERFASHGVATFHCTHGRLTRLWLPLLPARWSELCRGADAQKELDATLFSLSPCVIAALPRRVIAHLRFFQKPKVRPEKPWCRAFT